jgi:hypothetical protein
VTIIRDTRQQDFLLPQKPSVDPLQLRSSPAKSAPGADPDLVSGATNNTSRRDPILAHFWKMSTPGRGAGPGPGRMKEVGCPPHAPFATVGYGGTKDRPSSNHDPPAYPATCRNT